MNIIAPNMTVRIMYAVSAEGWVWRYSMEIIKAKAIIKNNGLKNFMQKQQTNKIINHCKISKSGIQITSFKAVAKNVLYSLFNFNFNRNEVIFVYVSRESDGNSLCDKRRH